MNNKKPIKIYLIQICYFIQAVIALGISGLGVLNISYHELGDIIFEFGLAFVGMVNLYSALDLFKYRISAWKIAISVSLINIVACVLVALQYWYQIQTGPMEDRIMSINELSPLMEFWLILCLLGIFSLIGLSIPSTRKYNESLKASSTMKKP